MFRRRLPRRTDRGKSPTLILNEQWSRSNCWCLQASLEWSQCLLWRQSPQIELLIHRRRCSEAFWILIRPWRWFCAKNWSVLHNCARSVDCDKTQHHEVHLLPLCYLFLVVHWLHNVRNYCSNRDHTCRVHHPTDLRALLLFLDHFWSKTDFWRFCRLLHLFWGNLELFRPVFFLLGDFLLSNAVYWLLRPAST